MDTLDLRVKRPLRDHPETEWPSWKNEAKVISLMLRNSGLQDKTISIETSIDPAVLSKIQTGQARLPEDKLNALMDATGSEAWLYYWLLKRGYDPRTVRRIESDVERENRVLREELETLRKEREIELRLLSVIRNN